MLRALEFQGEIGLIAAGAVNSSFIGRLPGKARSLGPVAGVSFRVASRIANTLRAGYAARFVNELNAVRLILFHSSDAQHDTLIGLLKSSGIQWPGKSLLFCESSTAGSEDFRAAGASVTAIRACPIPGRMIVEGENPSSSHAVRLIRSLRMKPIEIEAGSAPRLDTAITLATGAFTPLIDHTATLLRSCGLRDSDAMKVAALLFERTARDYAHSGRQSWAWYSREPDVQSLVDQLGAASPDLRPVIGELLVAGLRELGRHPEAARRIREALNSGQ